jgi:hypothetical protein
LYAKLGRRQLALQSYSAAAKLSFNDPDCNAHIQQLLHASQSALGANP